MLVPNDIFNQIDDLIERSYSNFTYQLLGKDFLTQDQKTQLEALGLLVGNRPMLELIYLLAKQRSEARYQDDRTLRDLLASIFSTGILSGLPDTARASIDNSSHAIDQSIDRTKSQVRDAIKFHITEYNKTEQQHARENGVLPVGDRLARDQAQSVSLNVAIGAALAIAHRAFVRDFTSELTTLVNNAAVDHAYETYDNPKEIYCMKSVVLDSRTSDHCKKYYLNADGSPTIYKLKDLLANGSNAGKRKSAWLPGVGSDHPNCRSQLRILGESPTLPK